MSRSRGNVTGPGGFIAISPGCGTVELSSEGGAEMLLFYNPELTAEHCYGGELHTMETWSTDWTPFVQASDQRHGLMYKSLRVPDVTEGHTHGGPGGMLRLVLILPGYTSPEHEFHEDSWEEILFVSGDIVMPNRGVGHCRHVSLQPCEPRARAVRLAAKLGHGLPRPQPSADGVHVAARIAGGDGPLPEHGAALSTRVSRRRRGRSARARSQ